MRGGRLTIAMINLENLLGSNWNNHFKVDVSGTRWVTSTNFFQGWFQLICMTKEICNTFCVSKMAGKFRDTFLCPEKCCNFNTNGGVVVKWIGSEDQLIILGICLWITPPPKLTWNLKMVVSKRNLLFQGSIFRFQMLFFWWNIGISSFMPCSTRFFLRVKHFHGS